MILDQIEVDRDSAVVELLKSELAIRVLLRCAADVVNRWGAWESDKDRPAHPEFLAEAINHLGLHAAHISLEFDFDPLAEQTSQEIADSAGEEKAN